MASTGRKNGNGEELTAKQASLKFQHMSAKNSTIMENGFFGMGAGQKAGANNADDSSNGELDEQMKLDNNSESAVSGMM